MPLLHCVKIFIKGADQEIRIGFYIAQCAEIAVEQSFA
jgi:hypothetical protein